MKVFLAPTLLLGPFILLAFVPEHGALSPQAYRVAAIFCSILLLWITEALPLPVTALLIPVLLCFFGITSPESAFATFGDSVIFLFLGAFLLAKAFSKHGLDQRIAYALLSTRLATSSLLALVLVLAAIPFAFSMWISNTATCAMMCPLVLGVGKSLRDRDLFPESTIASLETLLLLAVAYASSIGGIATPVGTPPNIITLGFLKERGAALGFLEWIAYALPVAVLLFGAMLATLLVLFRVPELSRAKLHSLQTLFAHSFRELPKLKSAEIWIAGTFFLTVFLWALPELTSGLFPDASASLWIKAHLTPAVVAIAAALLLFAIPASTKTSDKILTWHDAQSIDWGTMLLFGGGLALGKALQTTGLAASLAHFLFDIPGQSPLILFASVVTLAVLLTEIMSNTACASLLVPLILGLSAGEVHPAQLSLVIACSLASSASFMFPVATPANAIVFGTGRIRMRDMLRAGITLNVISIVSIVALLAL